MGKHFLVGNTGFVGSNLVKSHHFDGLYNSKNISDAFGKNPDLLIYAGVPARKFYANQHPKGDLEIIKNAEQNIKKINPGKLVLISTIDVISDSYDFYETSQTDQTALQPYGYNRLLLEEWGNSNFKNLLIVRLPALYGDNLKKNFIFDMIHPIPSIIEESQFKNLSSQNPTIRNYYQDAHDGFFALKDLDRGQKNILTGILKSLNFSTLNFTDSRAKYQFYNLKNLWDHLEIALNHNVNLLHLATEPISAAELYKYIFNQPFENHLDDAPADYNYKTIHADLYNGKNGYILDKAIVLPDIKSFITKKLGEG